MRTVLCLAIWLACALSVSHLIGESHRPRSGRTDAAWQVFNEDADSYDVLFFGSSRVYRGVIPEIFDGTLAERGFNVHSFNFGMRGMLPHETNELLRRVLAQKPAHLKWVILELSDWLPRKADRDNARTIAWHDLQETLSVLWTYWLQEVPLEERLESMRVQLGHFVSRQGSVGLGAAWAQLAFDRWTSAVDIPPPEEPFVYASRKWRGFAPFTKQEFRSGSTGKHRLEFVDSLGKFRKHVTILPQLNSEEAPVDSFNLAAIRQQVRRLEDAGVQVVYFTLPAYEALPILHRLIDAGEIPHALAFDDPDRWPEFYDQSHRFDLRHLNQEGAELFTAALAEGVADIMSESDV